jgi:hypothetical protein
MAEKLGITYETAHNVMKSISFSQIETRRQGELIALLAQLSRRPRDTEVLSEAGQLVIWISFPVPRTGVSISPCRRTTGSIAVSSIQLPDPSLIGLPPLLDITPPARPVLPRVARVW